MTYAMGKDKEVGGHFGALHGRNLTPHNAIWTLATISAVIGCLAVAIAFGDGSAPTDATIASIPSGFWSQIGFTAHTTHDMLAALPNSLLTIALASNFGTFILYALSCALCMVAYWKHPNFSFIRHLLIPIFGLVANLLCMGAYIVLPWNGIGTPNEPRLALAIAAVWAIYGAIYFLSAGRAAGKAPLLKSRTPVA